MCPLRLQCILPLTAWNNRNLIYYSKKTANIMMSKQFVRQSPFTTHFLKVSHLKRGLFKWKKNEFLQQQNLYFCTFWIIYSYMLHFLYKYTTFTVCTDLVLCYKTNKNIILLNQITTFSSSCKFPYFPEKKYDWSFFRDKEFLFGGQLTCACSRVQLFPSG